MAEFEKETEVNYTLTYCDAAAKVAGQHCEWENDDPISPNYFIEEITWSGE